MDDPPRSPDTGATPRWVKVFGVIVIVLALLVVVVRFAGDPGAERVQAAGMTPYGQRKQYQQHTTLQPSP